MAEKQVPLSIALRIVDKATGGMRAFKNKLDGLTLPVRQLGAGLSGLATEAGLPKLVGGFKSVGSAVKDLLSKLLVVGGIAAGAVVGVKSLVDEFDDLGDKAERLGVHVDFLAQMRFAAEKTGASVEQLDSGFQAFTQNLGQARAGTGRMAAFLKQVSPALLRQLKATQSNEEAFLLLADAMAKLQDPTKRLALAAKTSDAALAPLLSRGSKGVAELMQRFHDLAGSQDAAAEAAGGVDDSLKDLGASTTGLKAALITGLAPAMKVIVEQLSAWFVEHREDIRQWAADIGKRLPAAVDTIASSIKSAVGTVASIVDGIGGLKVVAGLAAAAIAGPLIASIASLGVALVSTPFGLILTGLAAVTAGVVLLIKNFDRLVDAARSVKEAIGDFVKPRFFDNLMQFDPMNPNNPIARSPFDAAQPATQTTEARVKIDIANAPRGTRVTADPRSTADVDLSVGYQMAASL